MDVVRAELQTISSLKSLGINLYRMPNGDCRIGIEEASQALGHPNNWLKRIFSKGNTIRVLKEIGFTREIKRVEIPLKLGNEEKRVAVSTLSLEDFNRLILYETLRGNKTALEILLSLATLGLNTLSLSALSQQFVAPKDDSGSSLLEPKSAQKLEASEISEKDQAVKNCTRTLLDVEYQKAHQLVMEHMKTEELGELETEDDILSVAVSLSC